MDLLRLHQASHAHDAIATAAQTTQSQRLGRNEDRTTIAVLN